MTEEPTANMTVHPSETAEASAASSHTASESNESAIRWQFDPPPKYSAAWWAANRDKSPHIGPEELRGTGIANEHAWVVQSLLGMQGQGICECESFTAFPTAADLLLWLRLHVIDNEIAWRCHNDFNVRRIVELEQLLEPALYNQSTEECLREIGPAFCREFYWQDIRGIWMIHEVLNTYSSRFGQICQDERAVCRDGRWSMPKQMWDAINEVLSDMDN